MKLRLLMTLAAAVAAAVMASSANAAASSWTWTEGIAEDTLMTEYETVDPWALQEAKTPQILGLSAAAYARPIFIAKHAATPQWVHCRGVGAHSEPSYFRRFWCTIHLWSKLSDYEATKPMTLVVTGRFTYRMLNGWH